MKSIRSGVVASLSIGILSFTSVAHAGVLDTVRGWFGEAPVNSATTPGIVAGNVGYSQWQSLPPRDAQAKANCDDLNGQLSTAQSQAIAQRQQGIDISAALKGSGVNQLLKGSGLDSILNQMRTTGQQAVTGAAQQAIGTQPSTATPGYNNSLR